MRRTKIQITPTIQLSKKEEKMNVQLWLSLQKVRCEVCNCIHSYKFVCSIYLFILNIIELWEGKCKEKSNCLTNVVSFKCDLNPHFFLPSHKILHTRRTTSRNNKTTNVKMRTEASLTFNPAPTWHLFNPSIFHYPPNF